MGARVLRTYERIANIDHRCDVCQEIIEPGSQYRAEVMLWQQRWPRERKLMVYKQHIYPSCDPPEDPWEENEFSLTKAELYFKQSSLERKVAEEKQSA